MAKGRLEKFRDGLMDMILEGLDESYTEGYKYGCEDTDIEYNKAISDGLKKGSFECAEKMVQRKKNNI